jgi:hypothetical protein
MGLPFQLPKPSMLKKIVLGVAVLLIVFAIVVAFQPSAFRVERRATIAAPAAVVFGEVNDLRRWEGWSPWEKLDPAMKKTHQGPPAGKGAIYSWAGNSEVGEGRMTITDSQPNELVRIRLEFLKPFAATSTTDFTFKPEAGKTNVVWTMAGENNFVAKAMCMFMNMDKMVGGDFEKGLAALKSISESKAR